MAIIVYTWYNVMYTWYLQRYQTRNILAFGFWQVFYWFIFYIY